MHNLTSNTLLCVLSVGYGQVGGVLSQVQTGIFPFLYYPVDDDNYFLGDKDARQQTRLITLSKIQHSGALYRARKGKRISSLFAYRSSELDACSNIYAFSYFAIGSISNTNALNWPEPGIFFNFTAIILACVSVSTQEKSGVHPVPNLPCGITKYA